MNCVDKFLDLVAPLPRKIVRLVKLLREVEENSKDLNIKLKNSREKHIQKLKDNSLKNFESQSLKSIENSYSELLTLSDYKIEIIKELNYLIEYYFINKISPIIEEGKKEVETGLTGTSSFPLLDKLTESISDIKLKEDMESKNSLLGNKKNRNIKKKKNNIENIQDLEKKYCKCNKECYGQMIECDNINCKYGQWFHLPCVGFQEGDELPHEWYCCSTCESEAKSKKTKNKRKKNN